MHFPLNVIRRRANRIDFTPEGVKKIRNMKLGSERQSSGGEGREAEECQERGFGRGREDI